MSLSTNILSGNTIYSGNTNLSDIFQTKTSELIEVDYYWIGKTAIDFAINSSGTRAAITFSDNTMEIINLTNSVQITAVTAVQAQYVRYCPLSDQFWAQKSDGTLIYRISSSGGSIIDTITLGNSLGYAYKFDSDNNYTYLSIVSGTTKGVLKIKQNDTGDTKFYAVAGNADKNLLTFEKGGNWYIASMSTYGYGIYDNELNLVCNLSTILESYGYLSHSVSDDGNYAAVVMNYYEPPYYFKLKIADISDFSSPSLLTAINKSYTGEILLDNNKIIWNTKPYTSGAYDGRILVADYSMTNIRMYPGTHRNYNSTANPIIYKRNEIYYMLFTSSDANVGTTIRMYKII